MAISDELRKLVDPNNKCCCEHCLSNKCKEWALINGITTINSGTCIYREMRVNPEEINTQSYCNTSSGLSTHKWVGSTQGHNENRFYAQTEPEAIFKACQWILDNKDKQ